tara:strand:+ start:11973 stop:12224 length:252 start_codon:yes stop_codon:yes gene_type:complete
MPFFLRQVRNTNTFHWAISPTAQKIYSIQYIPFAQHRKYYVSLPYGSKIRVVRGRENIFGECGNLSSVLGLIYILSSRSSIAH